MVKVLVNRSGELENEGGDNGERKQKGSKMGG